MKHAALLFSVVVVCLVDAINAIVAIPPEAYYNFTQMVGLAGADYVVEDHTATTPDGRILAVHRVQRADRNQSRAVPVLLMHGMVQSSADFIIMGRNRSLAYLLADAGFDVWAGDMRTTEFTNYVTLSKSDPLIWRYSLDELGALDLPAILETMKLATGTDRFHYVGYSMGTTVYHIMCSERPDLAARVVSYTALGPVATVNPGQTLLSLFLSAGPLKAIEIFALIVGPNNQQIRDLLTTVCATTDINTEICTRALLCVLGEDYAQFDWPLYPTIIVKVQIPSLRILQHYLQVVLTGTLSKYDYGKLENLLRYGWFTPPKYDVTANRAPAALYFGKNDLLATPEVALALAQKLNATSPVVYMKPIAYDKFNHVDYVWAKDVDTLLNHDVVQMILSFSNTYD